MFFNHFFNFWTKFSRYRAIRIIFCRQTITARITIALTFHNFYISNLKSRYLSTYSCSLRPPCFYHLIYIDVEFPQKFTFIIFQYRFWYILVPVGITFKVVLLTEKPEKFFVYFVRHIAILIYC